MRTQRARTQLLKTPFLEMYQVDYVDHLNQEKVWYGVSRANKIPAVEVVAVTEDNQLILVTQYRPYINQNSLELPAGLMDIPGEGIINAATRELREETGYMSREGGIKTHLLGDEDGYTVSSGITDERLHLVIITNCFKALPPQTDEGTEPVLVPFDNAIQSIKHLQYKYRYNVSYTMFGTISLVQNYLNGEMK